MYNFECDFSKKLCMLFAQQKTTWKYRDAHVSH